MPGVSPETEIPEEDKMTWKPQILTAMVLIALIAVVVTVLQPDFVEGAAGGAITGIGMLGMKLLEKE